MEKSRDAFRTISEVAELLDTPAHVLRFWESRFPQVRPVKRAGGRRYYRPTDVALLSGIKRLLHSDGLTIRGVQKVLREHGIRHVMAMADASIEAEEYPACRARTQATGRRADSRHATPGDAKTRAFPGASALCRQYRGESARGTGGAKLTRGFSGPCGLDADSAACNFARNRPAEPRSAGEDRPTVDRTAGSNAAGHR